MNFLPLNVKQYRLIGFDNRKDVLADSNSILEGGEIGTGHTVTAVFEVELNTTVEHSFVVADAELSYHPVENTERVTEKFSLPNNYNSILAVDSCYRFAAGVAMFGLMLKQSSYIKVNNWDVLINLLQTCVDPADYLQSEMLQLVKTAKELYKPVKQRKRWFRKKEKKEEIILF